MDCIIIHSNGWACSNKAERSARLSGVNLETNTAKRIHTFNADSIFNCIGSVEVGTQANIIFHENDKQLGWIVRVISVKDGNMKSERVKELTKEEIKGLITKIKK